MYAVLNCRNYWDTPSRVSSLFRSSGGLQPFNTTPFNGADVDMTMACWCLLVSNASTQAIMGQWGGTGCSYLLQASTTPRYELIVSSNGTAVAATATNNITSLLNRWSLVFAWHDAVNNEVGVQVDNGTVNTAAFSGLPGPFASGNAFRLGLTSAGTLSAQSARIDAPAVWRSNPGEGGVLTAAQRSAIWRAGRGTPYTAILGSHKAALQAWWQMGDTGGNRRDLHGGNPLVPSGGVVHIERGWV